MRGGKIRESTENRTEMEERIRRMDEEIEI
jgi:hypothetical protein